MRHLDLSVRPSVCLSVCRSVGRSVGLSVRLSVCVSVCLSVNRKGHSKASPGLERELDEPFFLTYIRNSPTMKTSLLLAFGP